MKMLLVLLVVGVALVGCSNPKTVTCKRCGSTAIKVGRANVGGVIMTAYSCPNEHITYLKE